MSNYFVYIYDGNMGNRYHNVYVIDTFTCLCSKEYIKYLCSTQRV